MLFCIFDWSNFKVILIQFSGRLYTAFKTNNKYGNVDDAYLNLTMNPLGGSHDAGINTSHIAASLGRAETRNSPEKPLVSLGVTAEESNSTVTLTGILNTKKGYVIISPVFHKLYLSPTFPGSPAQT